MIRWEEQTNENLNNSYEIWRAPQHNRKKPTNGSTFGFSFFVQLFLLCLQLLLLCKLLVDVHDKRRLNIARLVNCRRHFSSTRFWFNRNSHQMKTCSHDLIIVLNKFCDFFSSVFIHSMKLSWIRISKRPKKSVKCQKTCVRFVLPPYSVTTSHIESVNGNVKVI